MWNTEQHLGRLKRSVQQSRDEAHFNEATGEVLFVWSTGIVPFASSSTFHNLIHRHLDGSPYVTDRLHVMPLREALNHLQSIRHVPAARSDDAVINQHHALLKQALSKHLHRARREGVPQLRLALKPESRMQYVVSGMSLLVSNKCLVDTRRLSKISQMETSLRPRVGTMESSLEVFMVKEQAEGITMGFCSPLGALRESPVRLAHFCLDVNASITFQKAGIQFEKFPSEALALVDQALALGRAAKLWHWSDADCKDQHGKYPW